MAIRIPVYEDRLTPRADQQIQARAPQVDQSLGKSMEGLGNAGMTMAAVDAGVQREKMEADEIANAGAYLSERTAYFRNRPNDLSRRAVNGSQVTGTDGQPLVDGSGNAVTITQATKQEFESWAGSYLDSVRTPKTKIFVANHINSLRTAVMGDAMKLELHADIQNRSDKVDLAIRDYAGVAAMDETQAADALKNTMTMIANAGLDQHTQIVKTLQARQAIAGAAVQGAIQRNPAGVYQALEERYGAVGQAAATNPEGRAKQAYDYFTAQGFTPEQSAAAVANIRHESNFNEKLTHDGGIGVGILGWNGDRRKALEAKYGSAPTFAQQLEFMRDEMRGQGDTGMATWGKQQGGTAASLGADLSSVGVRPRDVEGNRAARGATAQQYYQQFSGQAPSGDGIQLASAQVSTPDAAPRPPIPDNLRGLVSQLDAPQVHTLLNEARSTMNAQEIQQRRNEAEAARLAKQRSDADETRVIADVEGVGNNSSVTAQQIADPKGPYRDLTPQARLTMIAFVDRKTKPDPLAVVSNQTSTVILDRMRLPEGNPNRITDMQPIYAAYIAGQLNRGDFTFLQDQFKNMGTDDGQKLSQEIKRLVDAAKPLIDKSNPLMGQIDQTGPMSLMLFERMINDKITEYRKAGKNPYDLFNPSSGDFLGAPGVIGRYQHNLNQSIQQLQQNLMRPPGTAGAPAATQRKPLDSIFGR